MFIGIRTSFFIFLFLIFSVAVTSAQSAGSFSFSEPRFDTSLDQTSSSGHIKLIWAPGEKSPNKSTVYQLQKSLTADFKEPTVIYTGADLATYMSGLADGTYYFRVRYIREGSDMPLSRWSDVLTLNVAHHSLKLALSLFVLGFFVFIATVIVLIKGVQDTKV